MNQLNYRHALLIVAAGLLSCSLASADTVAIAAGVQTGNQQWTGSIGNDFTVNSPVLITQLGAFDSGANGFSGTIRVVIYNATTQTQVTPVASLTGTTQPITNGDRFAAITPVLLPIGNYTVVAIGFSASDLDGDLSCNGNTVAGTECLGNNINAATLNTGGLLTFGGTRNGPDNGTLVYPTNTFGDPASASGLLAGTFEFTAPTAGVPEPGAAGLLALGIAGLGLIGRALSIRKTSA